QGARGRAAGGPGEAVAGGAGGADGASVRRRPAHPTPPRAPVALPGGRGRGGARLRRPTAGARPACPGREGPAMLGRPRPRRGPAAPDAVRALRGRGRVSLLGDSRVRLALLVGVAVLVADQVTKAVIQRTMYLHETIPLTSFFAITYVRNTGAAFGIL